MILLNSAQSILSIVFMIGIGYILSRKGWFNEDTSKLFSKLVINISLPAMMITNIIGTFTKENLSQAGIGLLIPFISVVLSYILGVCVSKLIKVSPKRRGTFQCMFFLSNTIFIGLPVNLALFGEASMPFVLYYYFSNTTIFWTLGIYIIQKDGGFKSKNMVSLSNLKKIFTPPLMGFIFAIICVLLDIKLPRFVLDSCKYIGNLTTPLSMFFIGIVIKTINFKNFKFDKDMFWVMVGRFIVCPLITYLTSNALNAPTLMKNVFIIQAALPVMANTAIVTKEYNADYEYAAVMIALTTIASLAFIPIYRFLLG
ncbi:AEC family transporter [Clostridium swellfunianum]|uniref:AEC family transporter n=1 Tax=Clostridium swellfunianum TaxID=1367462 RepID=UPI00202ECD51|nr:AEC family transporter [Clostridium swellfunianum]MCM0649749.1 AEC family transporter [Clostridium swellfunianum]